MERRGAQQFECAQTSVAEQPRPIALPITAAVLGILGILGLFAFGVGMLLAPLTIVLAIIALVRALRWPQCYRGTVLATIGLVGGVIGIVWWPVLIAARQHTYGPWGVLLQADARASLQATWRGLTDLRASEPSAPPADLERLVALDLVAAGELRIRHGTSEHQVTDLHYVAGLQWSDPGNWIVAYADPGLFDNQGGGVLHLDGSIELLDRADFDNRIRDFIAAFTEARGHPPTTAPPH